MTPLLKHHRRRGSGSHREAGGGEFVDAGYDQPLPGGSAEGGYLRCAKACPR
jgi:hypothetical protein